jgi:hypothetical protein
MDGARDRASGRTVAALAVLDKREPSASSFAWRRLTADEFGNGCAVVVNDD